MWSALKSHWREFRKGRPGSRFQDRYERHQRENKDKPWYLRFIKPVAGVVLLVAGLIFCFIPGPGLPLLLIGGGLLADVSRLVARVMDWSEVTLRKLISWAVGWWKHASGLARKATVFFLACGILGGGYGAYHLMFGH